MDAGHLYVGSVHFYVDNVHFLEYHVEVRSTPLNNRRLKMTRFTFVMPASNALAMKPKSTQIENWPARALRAFIGTALVLTLAGAALAGNSQIKDDQKTKITGTIVSRNGDLVKVTNKKTGSTATVVIRDNTKIERKSFKHEFFVHKDMDVTTMVPGLTIKAEGIGNAKGQLVAKTISFVPDSFSVEVAEEQQIIANQAATATAQTTAQQGVQQARAAQVSANYAQTSANDAGAMAEDAGELAVYNAEDVALVNKRVSDLDEYKTAGEAGIYFESGQSTLDAAAKADLDSLASSTKGLDNYMIEIAGYASSTGSKQLNQKLSADRAAAVAHYLAEKQNVPMRRILAPAGYGATHPAATNNDSQGRALNRRVEVKILVNKGLNEGE
jgi:outer membrane protein OmpA-like peptidoglycan-associated protein